MLESWQMQYSLNSWVNLQLTGQGGYKLEAMNERRDQYIAVLRSADKHDFSQLLEFVGA